MTLRKLRKCAWCGEGFAANSGSGRPAKYCRRSHRQRAFEARREGHRRSLNEDEVLISGRAWERLKDALYRLEAASEDVAMDLLAGRPTKADYVQAFAYLSEAVRGLGEVALEPTAVGQALE